eukprot:SAG22_NODE_607_length_8603_cov_4.554327_7_plen_79_part_00
MSRSVAPSSPKAEPACTSTALTMLCPACHRPFFAVKLAAAARASALPTPLVAQSSGPAHASQLLFIAPSQSSPEQYGM